MHNKDRQPQRLFAKTPLQKVDHIVFVVVFLQLSAVQICLCFQPFNRMDQSLLRKPIYSKLLALYDNYDVSKVVTRLIPNTRE